VDLFGEIASEYTDDGTVVGDNAEDTRLARQAAVSVSYPLLDGLRAINQVYKDANLLDAEIIRLSDAAETISLNAVQAYIDVFRRNNIVKISEENIDVHVEIARQVEQQVEAGRLSEPDRFRPTTNCLRRGLRTRMPKPRWPMLFQIISWW
jgi:adhesin transport system outer membrane protein